MTEIPGFKWHIKVIAPLIIILAAAVFLANLVIQKLPYPYDKREIPAEITPWRK